MGVFDPPLDARFDLTSEHRRDCLRNARHVFDRARGQWTRRMPYLAILTAWLVAAVAMPISKEMLQISIPSPVVGVGNALFFVAIVLTFRREQRDIAPFFYRELRIYGHEACFGCGYSLAELDSNPRVCPECGAIDA